MKRKYFYLVAPLPCCEIKIQCWHDRSIFSIKVKKVIIIKFGGSSLATPEWFINVVEIIGYRFSGKQWGAAGGAILCAELFIKKGYFHSQ